MKKLHLLTILALCLMLTLSACGTAPAANTPAASTPAATDDGQVWTLKIAHSGSEAMTVHQALLQVGEQIEKNSGGRIKVSYYPNGQLGSESSVIEGLQNGDIEMANANCATIAAFDKELNVLSLPFALPNEEIAYKVLDGPFGQKLSANMETNAGVIGMGYLGSPTFRQLMGNKVVHTPADLKGMKVRTMDNPVQLEIWKSLGANPTPIPFAELYSALQQGTVDAQENPLEICMAMRFYEVSKNVILTNHLMTISQTVVSPKFYYSLPEDLQKVVRDACYYGQDWERQAFKDNYPNYIQTLEENGVTITTLTPEESQQFKDMSAPAYDYVRNMIGDEIVDEYLAAIEAAEQN
jgi:tripartite ATP-independent transporter DctP family solute receptor